MNSDLLSIVAGLPRSVLRMARRAVPVLCVLMLATVGAVTLSISQLVPVVAEAIAQDDDGGGDDGDDDGNPTTPGGGGVDNDNDGDDGGGGNPPGEPPVGTDDIPQNIDDGDNIGPRDENCFEEAALRPAWLRPCDDRPPFRPTVTPQPVATPRVPSPPRSQQEPSRPTVAQPQNALPNEIVAVRLSQTQLNALETRGFVLLVRSPGPLGVGELFRLEVPAGLSTAQAMELARRVSPGAIIDFNHIYRPAQSPCTELFCKQRLTIKWPQPPGECRIDTSIGLIDTTIDRLSPALSGQRVTILDGVSAGRSLASMNHGTAIAALLVGRSDAAVPGLLPKSEVVSVQAFHTSSSGEDIADTFDIVSSIDTLLKRGLKIINLSFAGPNNRVLADIVAHANSGGAVLVAAAGNRGPTGPVVYPAGYESVVAVTAVGDDLRIYRGANRGQYVDFAAPGVEVQVVSAKVETRFETGTSFAAPFITAALAALKAQKPDDPPLALVAALQQTATDLGSPGRDPVFGWGLVQVPEVCQ